MWTGNKDSPCSPRLATQTPRTLHQLRKTNWPPSLAFPREQTRQRLCLAFSYFLPLSPSFSFLFSPSPFHHFPSEALPSGRGRAGLTPCLSPAPAALWREGAPSSPGHQRRRSEERDRRRRRPRAQGHHGTSSLSDPSAAAVRPARVPAPAGPVCPLLPPQTARSRAPRRRAPRIMRR